MKCILRLNPKPLQGIASFLLIAILYSCGGSPPDVDPSYDPLEEIQRRLTPGDFYYDVPKSMTVGVSSSIKAGVVESYNEKIKSALGLSDDTAIKEEIYFDSRGTTINLVVNEDAFSVREISVGKKAIVNEILDPWIWEVTPRKSGRHLVVIKVVIELEGNSQLPKVVYEERLFVKANPGFSFIQIIVNNWKDFMPWIFGSGSVTLFFTWALGLDTRDQRNKNRSTREESTPEEVSSEEPIHEEQVDEMSTHEEHVDKESTHEDHIGE